MQCPQRIPLCSEKLPPDIDFRGRRNFEVARYGQNHKDRVIARLLPPESSAVDVVSRQVGISVATWRIGGRRLAGDNYDEQCASTRMSG